MHTGRRSKFLRATLFLALGFLVIGSGTPAVAETTSSSSSYEASEMKFGAGSSEESCSDQYCARVSIGDSSVGDASGTTTKATFGPVTPDTPSLEVIVDPGVSNLGVLTTEQTGTKTMIVRVRSYLSNGYTLQVTGTPPTYSGHTLATPASPTSSTPGTEQFGINVTKNTTPNVGEFLEQVPDNQTSFGEVTSNYNQANKFMYVSGDTVGRSLTESGRTDYTISMIVNIANDTPAGQYNGEFSAVVIPAY